MKPTFYINARGEYVMTRELFATLDPLLLASGKLSIRPQFRSER